jgi:SagB-type dehydrogenase family enzyme
LNFISLCTNAKGLPRGFYHDADGHALTAIDIRPEKLETLLTGAQFAMGAPDVPQILITLAARFGRISWKYSSIAYALILKDVGVSNVLLDGDRLGPWSSS